VGKVIRQQKEMLPKNDPSIAGLDGRKQFWFVRELLFYCTIL